MYNPTFKINLVRLFNTAFSGSSVSERNQLRGALSSTSFRDQFGKAVIDRIIQRTSQESKDKDGKPFPKYSDSYMKSDVFKIYGKSSKVNLELTGEMLSSMKAIDASQSIVIEMIGDNNKAKAQGHKYGLGKKRVKRDFLGLPQDDLNIIMISTISDYQDQAYAATQELFVGAQQGITFGGQVGNQSGFSASVSVGDLLRMINENLNGQ